MFRLGTGLFESLNYLQIFFLKFQLLQQIENGGKTKILWMMQPGVDRTRLIHV